jgi:lipopolysaccharide exporter
VLVLGRLLDASAVGVFSLAREIASIPSSTLVAPLNRAAFPGYAQMSHDARQLRDGYKSILGLIALVVMPATVGIAAVAALIVPVALGPKWQAAVPFLALLSLSGASRSLTASTISVHYATGQPSKQTLTTGIQAVTLFPAVAIGVGAFGAIGAAWAYLVHSILIFMPVCYWILLRTTPIRVSDVWQPVWRPVLASAIMFAATKPMADAWATPETLDALPRLLGVISIGAMTYVCSIALLWWLAGRPEGAEKALVRRVLPRLPTWLPGRRP